MRSPGVPLLIYVALVAFIALKLFNVFVRFVDAFAAVLLHNFAQRSIDILRHPARVAAHEKVCALGVEPFPNLGSVFQHAVLHVNFFALIAGPGAIESCESSLSLVGLELVPIGKIAALVLRPEEEPVFPLCSGCFSLLQVRAEWRDSGSGTNHDDGSLRILRQMKMFCDAREDGYGHVISAFRKKG